MSERLRVNVGCGATPTPGWLNLDNSSTLLLTRFRPIERALLKLRLIGEPQAQLTEAARRHGVRRASATRLPLPDRSAAAIYSSHMLEHLDQEDARAFLREARRVLVQGGILRIAVPDLRRLAKRYLNGGNADEFMRDAILGRTRPRTVLQTLKQLTVGDRHHLWMYDADSLSRLLESEGFVNVAVMAPGTTAIPDPGALDLRERPDESVYLEAQRW